ncbi:MAG: RNA polymerase sigma factor [Planctomycetales bacterium]|nr:RNA polymerase sigma factor [Planctomycetales bacterium]
MPELVRRADWEPPPRDITQLAERCVRGDEWAMAELVERYRSPVFGLCLRMLSHRQDAEDVAQETFARALRYLNSWDRTRSFERWLLAIAGNRCRTFLGKRQRKTPMVHLESDPVDHDAIRPGASTLAEEVRIVLQTIRPEYCQAFLLFHEQQLTYAEIADYLGYPLGTIKTWVHRARKQLIARLAERDVIGGSEYALRRV